jgi:hypothetical protein
MTDLFIPFIPFIPVNQIVLTGIEIAAPAEKHGARNDMQLLH